MTKDKVKIKEISSNLSKASIELKASIQLKLSCKPKAIIKSKTSSKSKASPSFDEVKCDSEEITLIIEVRIDLAPK